MKITEDARKYTARLGLSKEDASKKGMEEKSKKFVKKSTEAYAKAQISLQPR